MYLKKKRPEELDFNRIKTQLESIKQIELVEPIYIKKANSSYLY